MIKRNILLLLALLSLSAASLMAQSVPCVTPSTVEYDTICSDGYRFFGVERLTTPGTYHDTLITDAGCDSAVTLHLYVVHSNAYTATACDSYTFGSLTFTESGKYLGSPYMAMAGMYTCVLFDTLDLTINKSVHTYNDTTVCDSLRYWGLLYTLPGVYTHSSTTPEGCMQRDTLALTIATGTFNSEEQTSCDTFWWHGNRYTRTGHYNYRYRNAAGCPSNDTLHLTIKNGEFNSIVTSACDSYTWIDGKTYTETTGPVVYENYINGCYSVDTLMVTVNYTTYDTIKLAACDNYMFNLIRFNNSIDTTMRIGFTEGGCDSIVTLNVTIYHSWRRSYDSVVCDSMAWGDTMRYATGTYVYYIPGPIANCDTLETLHLTVNTTHYHEFFLMTNQNFRYGDSLWTESGHYLYRGTTYQGCDSIVDITLEIIDSAHVWAPDSTIAHWTPDVHIYSYANRMLLVSHYNNDSTNYMNYYEYRWYRDGVYLRAPSIDYYVEPEGELQPGRYWVEVALNVQRTDWAVSDTLTVAPSAKAIGSKPQITVAPNPVQSGAAFTVSLGGVDKEATLSLYDVQGRLCWTATAQDNSVVVDTKLPAGVYVLQLSQRGTEPVMRKVVVR